MRLLNLRMSPQEWMESRLKRVRLDPKEPGSLLNYFTAAMLHLNDGDVDAARSIACQFFANPLIKEIAEEKKQDEILSERHKKNLRFIYHVLLRINGDKGEADKFYNSFLQKSSPNDDDFKARRWNLMVDRVIARNICLGDDNFLNIPYRKMDPNFFCNTFYYCEFAKIMLKNDSKHAKKLIEKLKEYLEQPNNIDEVFDNHHYFYYIDMLEALAEVKPDATKLVKEYQQWKEHVGW
jgi:hypothetical protein